MIAKATVHLKKIANFGRSFNIFNISHRNQSLVGHYKKVKQKQWPAGWTFYF